MEQVQEIMKFDTEHISPKSVDLESDHNQVFIEKHLAATLQQTGSDRELQTHPRPLPTRSSQGKVCNYKSKMSG